VPTAGDLSLPGERSHRTAASTLTFQLLKIDVTGELVKRVSIKI